MPRTLTVRRSLAYSEAGMWVAQYQSNGIVDVMNGSLVFREIATMPVVIGAIVVLALTVRRLVSHRPPAATSARYILAERYSSGEIGRDEYEQKRRDL